MNEKKLYKDALQEILKKLELGLNVFINQYPHVSKNNIYSAENNTLWTSSFFPGICYLAYQMTGDKKYLSHQESYLDSFEDRIVNRRHISHDLGFLYTLSCVAAYQLNGSKRAYDLAHLAADVLTERYNEKGQYIQAWGEMGVSYPDVKIIIDTMLNLPLLYWTGNQKNYDIAYNHAKTTAKYLVRKDFSTYHTYLMRPETGEAVCGKTHQGYADESTWARGQAWAVYGFILSYRYTKDKEFLHIAKETARVFIENLPKDFVPYWDFHFTDNNPDIKDTSAAAIFCCGLLELCQFVGEEDKKYYHSIVYTMIKSLFENYSTKGIKESNGFLTEGVYHRGDGAEECVIWGDYFYFEAITRLLKDAKTFW
ncbi:MAG TPA: glucoronyl hydrolase [Lachnospiraceae bacterium]|nr:glucoronyl hydrolase [Lachnospiraceae bacterium]HCA69118.1 glucoronyl hydrolase [Lachnospiraceae bacterium]HCM13108.1 glucoronyl hydrolase [Lachnospiraceae bacterium]